ncbi:RcpC/CpaB family pilus assembly protein [Streptomyces sp. NPDC048442]|uniref:RcpC/CpaB family pilus assembly protein n=1 Tax=Streptomyces sp. NPDC048442 TaxID=3154823 RepID=UPI0034247622
MPEFAPLRLRGGGVGHRLRRAVRRRRRAVAVGLAVTATALVASAPRATERTEAPAEAAGAPGQVRQRTVPHAELVSAPVRIADAATVRLLRRGDRVDVIASANSPHHGGSSPAKVVAAGVRVVDVPRPGEGSSQDGALVVLSVPRSAAAQLAGAGATSRLAVTLW